MEKKMKWVKVANEGDLAKGRVRTNTRIVRVER